MKEHIKGHECKMNVIYMQNEYDNNYYLYVNKYYYYLYDITPVDRQMENEEIASSRSTLLQQMSIRSLTNIINLEVLLTLLTILILQIHILNIILLLRLLLHIGIDLLLALYA